MSYLTYKTSIVPHTVPAFSLKENDFPTLWIHFFPHSVKVRGWRLISLYVTFRTCWEWIDFVHLFISSWISPWCWFHRKRSLNLPPTLEIDWIISTYLPWGLYPMGDRVKLIQFCLVKILFNLVIISISLGNIFCLIGLSSRRIHFYRTIYRVL